MTLRYASADRYLPIDELLEQPRVRVLRVLRHFDWLSLTDILGVLNEPDYGPFWHAIDRLVKDGHVDRRADRVPHLFSITSSGRELYDALLRRTLVDEQERPRAQRSAAR